MCIYWHNIAQKLQFYVLGDAWRAPKVGRCQVRWATPTRGSGGAPQRGPGQSHGRKLIWAYFEGHRTLLCVPICDKIRGAICISVPYSKFWGACPPVTP